MLKITTIESAPKVPFQLDGKIMFSKPDLEIIHLTLKPGEIIAKHINDFDVIMYFIQGEGLIETKSSSTAFLVMMAEIKSGEERGLTNKGLTDVKLLILKLLQSK